MSELTTQQRQKILLLSELTTLDDVPVLSEAMQSMLERKGRELDLHVQTSYNSYFNTCRLITEVHEAVDVKNWLVWLAEHGFSRSSGYESMKMYERFGAEPGLYGSIDKSKLIRMLSLPAGTEQQFVESHDLDSMSVREVAAEVRKEKRKDKPVEDAAAAESADDTDIVAQLKAEYEARIAAKEQDIEQLKTSCNNLIAERIQKDNENQTLKSQLTQKDTDIAILQETLNNANQSSWDVYSMSAGGGDLHSGDTLDANGFAVDVASFIGKHATLVNSDAAFSMMDPAEKNTFRDQIKGMREWLDRLEKTVNLERMEMTIR